MGADRRRENLFEKIIVKKVSIVSEIVKRIVKLRNMKKEKGVEIFAILLNYVSGISNEIVIIESWKFKGRTVKK